ncbi:hypothetical protein JCM10550A_12930 [Methanogenium cariaci]
MQKTEIPLTSSGFYDIRQRTEYSVNELMYTGRERYHLLSGIHLIWSRSAVARGINGYVGAVPSSALTVLFLISVNLYFYTNPDSGPDGSAGHPNK